MISDLAKTSSFIVYTDFDWKFTKPWFEFSWGRTFSGSLLLGFPDDMASEQSSGLLVRAIIGLSSKYSCTRGVVSFLYKVIRKPRYVSYSFSLLFDGACLETIEYCCSRQYEGNTRWPSVSVIHYTNADSRHLIVAAFSKVSVVKRIYGISLREFWIF